MNSSISHLKCSSIKKKKKKKLLVAFLKWQRFAYKVYSISTDWTMYLFCSFSFLLHLITSFFFCDFLSATFCISNYDGLLCISWKSSSVKKQHFKIKRDICITLYRKFWIITFGSMHACCSHYLRRKNGIDIRIRSLRKSFFCSSSQLLLICSRQTLQSFCLDWLFEHDELALSPIKLHDINYSSISCVSTIQSNDVTT